MASVFYEFAASVTVRCFPNNASAFTATNSVKLAMDIYKGNEVWLPVIKVRLYCGSFKVAILNRLSLGVVRFRYLPISFRYLPQAPQGFASAKQ